MAVKNHSCGNLFWIWFIFNDVLNEDSKCIPSSLYGKCKNNLHDDLLYFLDEYNYDLIWARIFYPYGLGEEKRKFISYIIDSIKNDKKLFIKQPNDVLDYIHVSDIAEALSLLTNSNVSGTFNVCSGNQVKVENIIHYIRSKFSKSVDIEYSQNSVSKYIVGNASKITKLGFNCKYDIYKGIDTYFCKDWGITMIEVKEDPITKFKNECEQEIAIQGDDKEFQDLSKKWATAAVKHKYSYHFSWFGRPIIQLPTDIVAMQQIIW